MLFLSVQVIRGTAAAPLSQLLTSLEPQLRLAAGLSAWQVVSPAQGRAGGRLEAAAQLRDVQHSRYQQPTILLVDRVQGDEEIPEVILARFSAMHHMPLIAMLAQGFLSARTGKTVVEPVHCIRRLCSFTARQCAAGNT